jgi:hypothetical protein
MRNAGKRARDESGKHPVNENDEENFRACCDEMRVPMHAIVLSRHCEEQGDEAIHPYAAQWIASRSLSSGAHSCDPVARDDDGNVSR